MATARPGPQFTVYRRYATAPELARSCYPLFGPTRRRYVPSFNDGYVIDRSSLGQKVIDDEPSPSNVKAAQKIGGRSPNRCR